MQGAISLMMLTQIEEQAIRSSRKNMDAGVRIIFLHRAHIIGYLLGQRDGVLPARDASRLQRVSAGAGSHAASSRYGNASKVPGDC